MDQIKIGRFIDECRKKEDLTQMQSAEKGYKQGMTYKKLPDRNFGELSENYGE